MSRWGVRAVIVAAGTIALDQATKWVAVKSWEDSPLSLGPARLSVTRNSGSAFSLFPGLWWLVFAAVAAVTVAAVTALRRPHPFLMDAGLGLVLGGAWSNLIDRVLRWPGFPNGRVADFVDLRVWPVFNAADSAIVIGVGLLLLGSVRTGEGAARG